MPKGTIEELEKLLAQHINPQSKYTNYTMRVAKTNPQGHPFVGENAKYLKPNVGNTLLLSAHGDPVIKLRLDEKGNQQGKHYDLAQVAQAMGPATNNIHNLALETCYRAGNCKLSDAKKYFPNLTNVIGSASLNRAASPFTFAPLMLRAGAPARRQIRDWAKSGIIGDAVLKETQAYRETPKSRKLEKETGELTYGR